MHRAAAVALALLLPAAVSAQVTAASLARAVDAHYNHLHSLQARYAERYQGLGIDRTETGTLTLEKPGRMRWAYDAPPGKLFLLDGKEAISYTPGDLQAQRTPEKQLDDLRSPLRLLLGHAELSKELTGLTLTLVSLDGRTGYTLSGTPRGDARLRSLSLTVDAVGSIHSMRIEDAGGATTTFTFTDVREDLPTPPNDFIFTPPSGVSIVNSPPPI